MTRDYAVKILRDKLKNTNLFKHCLAAEACLRELAVFLNEDVEKWGLAGLLHDIDYEETKSEPMKHGNVGADYLETFGIEPDIIHAIRVHAGHGAPQTKLDWGLFAADPLTGLIVAAALMHPDKQLKSLDAEFVLRRFKEKRFAAGANREQIQTCSRLDLELDKFISICLKGMQNVSDELGL
jgi:putative nucleotidyltransferase with HDIG domain